ncbi:L-fucose dehydrogenase [Gynurincola endophyticus]|uniref:SDR family oxidoreductase n=1 Tax=Gynurincola endophyticus TaxID=2479004 RepID=UPI000F8E5F01|nr:SDR family oxidoreductase [Gynurincola endophyticus]
MDLQLKNKNFIVTGGAKGIGAAIAFELAKEGALPIIIGRNQHDNENIQTAIHAAGGQCATFEAELNERTDYAALHQRITTQFKEIHGIVNNAGANDGVGLKNGNIDLFVKSIHKNVTHYFGTVQCFLNELIQTKGAIVNISSKVAETGQGGTSGYAAANGARNALTREWAVELIPYAIRVNAVVVAESFTPLYQEWIKTLPAPDETLKKIISSIPFENRMTKPEEIAHMVLFLLSKLSSHTTGQIIHVDGGYVHLDRAITHIK